MRGYHLNDDDVLRRTLINRLLCHTLIRKSEIADEFGINFDDYFRAELAHPGTVRSLCGRVSSAKPGDEISVTSGWDGFLFATSR